MRDAHFRLSSTEAFGRIAPNGMIDANHQRRTFRLTSPNLDLDFQIECWQDDESLSANIPLVDAGEYPDSGTDNQEAHK